MYRSAKVAAVRDQRVGDATVGMKKLCIWADTNAKKDVRFLSRSLAKCIRSRILVCRSNAYRHSGMGLRRNVNFENRPVFIKRVLA
jgi:hypothetical protein